MRWGTELPGRHSLSTLRVIGTVGEPINPEASVWYNEFIGRRRCPIVDTWWQTETGMILISPLPGLVATKPGSATRPRFPALSPKLSTPKAIRLDPERAATGARTPLAGHDAHDYGDRDRYVQQYWSRYPGMYFTGDGCKMDEDGYFWLLGRVDNVMNVAGHRISTYRWKARWWIIPPWLKPRLSAGPTTSRARASPRSSR